MPHYWLIKLPRRTFFRPQHKAAALSLLAIASLLKGILSTRMIIGVSQWPKCALDTSHKAFLTRFYHNIYDDILWISAVSLLFNMAITFLLHWLSALPLAYIIQISLHIRSVCYISLAHGIIQSIYIYTLISRQHVLTCRWGIPAPGHKYIRPHSRCLPLELLVWYYLLYWPFYFHISACAQVATDNTYFQYVTSAERGEIRYNSWFLISDTLITLLIDYSFIIT